MNTVYISSISDQKNFKKKKFSLFLMKYIGKNSINWQTMGR